MDISLYSQLFEPSRIYFSEKRLHHLWSQYLWKKLHQSTTGQKISIISTGKHNDNEGPDFLNSQIIIDDNYLTGDIEIHFDNHDWYYHFHHKDKKYNNCILHIVFRKVENTDHVLTENGKKVPILYIPYQELENYPHKTKCRLHTKSPDEFFHILEKYGLLRFNKKTDYFFKQSSRFNFDLMFFWGIFKSSGYRYNQENMVKLFLRFPWKDYFNKKLLPEKIEKILFQLAELEINNKDEYSEYLFTFDPLINQYIHKQYNNIINWTYSRTRPTNFPDRRIGWLTQFLKKYYNDPPTKMIFNMLQENNDWSNQIGKFLTVSPNKYWQRHYRFGKETDKTINTNFGKGRRDEIALNIILPLLFAYNLKNIENDNFRKKILYYVKNRKLTNEYNKIKKYYNKHNIPIENKKRKIWINSQGVLYINENFCSQDLQELCPICNLNKKGKDNEN